MELEMVMEMNKNQTTAPVYENPTTKPSFCTEYILTKNIVFKSETKGIVTEAAGDVHEQK